MPLAKPTFEVFNLNCQALDPLADHSVHMAFTSPPYLGQRAYPVGSEVWPRFSFDPVSGGVDFSEGLAALADCAHEWGPESSLKTDHKPTGKQTSGTVDRRAPPSSGCWCQKCGAWYGVLGNEPLWIMYVAHLVYVAREIRRVLRPDGLFGLNLGDTYIGSFGNYGDRSGGQRGRTAWRKKRPAWDEYTARPPQSMPQPGLKPKDLAGLPWRVAFALQGDGWYLRSAVVWAKGCDFVGKEWEAQETVRAALGEVRATVAGSLFGLSDDLDAALKKAARVLDDLLMVGAVTPESTKARPTTAHEYLFLLSPTPDPYFDIFALRMAPSNSSLPQKDPERNPKRNPRTVWMLPGDLSGCDFQYPGEIWRVGTRGKGTFILDDGREVPHYAAFPEELPRRAIRAGTSEAGACAQCGAPWIRKVERIKAGDGMAKPYSKGQGQDSQARWRRLQAHVRAARYAGGAHDNPFAGFQTVGWIPTCRCHGDPDRGQVTCPRCHGLGYERTTVHKKDAFMPDGERRESHKRGMVGDIGSKSMEATGELCSKCEGAGTVEGDVWPSEVLEAWPREPCTVVDFMAGTGTTGRAALAEGRSTVLNDLSPDYADLCWERLTAWPDDVPEKPPDRKRAKKSNPGNDFQLTFWEGQ